MEKKYNLDNEKDFSRCRNELCGKFIWYYQCNYNGYCSTDCVEEAKHWRGRDLKLATNGGTGKEKKQVVVKEDSIIKQEYPHRLYPDTVLII